MTQQTKKVLVIGWDGADWKVASPLIDQGKMPNLCRLIENGVMGNISTLYPVLSPMLWTSIATGKRAHKHGIHGFAEPDFHSRTVRPISNVGRKCKAVWNILNQNDKRCNVVGWWPSHPAEPINGVMVSNHFQTSSGQNGSVPMRTGTVHPQSLAASLAKFRVHPFELEGQQLLPFVPRAQQIDQENDKRIFNIAKSLAEASSIHAVATAIMQHEPWDFMAVYYDSIDHFSHGFMKYHPPKLPWIQQSDFDNYQHVIESAYCFHDMMLGALLTIAGDDTNVILLSDHGFHPDQLRPQSVGNEPAGPADEHRRFGMLVMSGPDFKSDELVFGASLLDITPTILTLFNLPVGRDMDGLPLTQALRSEPKIQFNDSWETIDGDDGRHPEDLSLDSGDNEEAMNQLMELGYIEQPDEDQQITLENTKRELQYNVARDYMDCNLYPEGIAILTELWTRFPDQSRFGVKLFFCQLKMNQTDAADSTLKQIIERKNVYSKESLSKLESLKNEFGDSKPGEMDKHQVRKIINLRRKAATNPEAIAFFQGCLYFSRKQYELALNWFDKAGNVQTHNQPALKQKQAECLIGLQRFKDAETKLNEILQIDRVNPDAFLGLAQCQLATHNPAKAADSAQSSIGLIYQNPKAHYLLGTALHKLGKIKEAVISLNTAVRQNPGYTDAHQLLATLYESKNQHQLAQFHSQKSTDCDLRSANFNQTQRPQPGHVNDETTIDTSIEYGIRNLDNSAVATDPGNIIYIVSGLPRSGTSMMMQLLSAGGLELMTDNQRQPDQSNPLGYFELEDVKKLNKSNDWLPQAQGKCIKVITQLLPFLIPDLSYRILYMTRPLEHILASQTRMLASKNVALDVKTERLAESFIRQTATVQKQLGRFRDVSVLNVSYEQTVKSPAQVINTISQFIPLELDQQKMAHAVQAKLRHH